MGEPILYEYLQEGKKNGGEKCGSRFVSYNWTVDEVVEDNLRPTFFTCPWNILLGLFKAFILRQCEMGLKEFGLAFDKIEILAEYTVVGIMGWRNHLLLCLVD